MGNIEFVPRPEAAEIIEKAKKPYFIVVEGRRRIGKTTFLKHHLPDAIYIFVWPNKSLHWILKRVCEDNNLPLFQTMTDLLRYCFEKNRPVIIDEFQNFLHIDKSVYGEIQYVVDSSDNHRLAVAGSSYSLMNKVFEDEASPLYGRRTATIPLTHLPIPNLYKAVSYSIEEFIELWSVFEGVPYYYELLQDLPRNTIKNLLLTPQATLQNEGNAILNLEFGADSKTYGTVISTIAAGKNTVSEIAGAFGNDTSTVTKYLSLLRKQFNLVQRHTPILEDPRKSRKSKYKLRDNFLTFWLRFVEGQQDLIEQQRYKEVETHFEEHFSAHIGKMFERFILTLLKTHPEVLPHSFDKVGQQWGKNRNKPKGQQAYEVDIVAPCKKSKNITFGECKWKDNVSGEKLLRDLKQKAKGVQWYKEEREEVYVLIAKSFKDRPKEAITLDLGSIEEILTQ